MQEQYEGMNEMMEKHREAMELQAVQIEEQKQESEQLHVASYLHRSVQREQEIKAEKAKHSNLTIKRSIGFLKDLLFEVEDVKEAWNKIVPEKKQENDTAEEEEDDCELEQLIKDDNIDDANKALQCNRIITKEIKKKLEKEVFLNEVASMEGWWVVQAIEQKELEKLSGNSAADKEMKLAIVKKAKLEVSKNNMMMAQKQGRSGKKNLLKIWTDKRGGYKNKSYPYVKPEVAEFKTFDAGEKYTDLVIEISFPGSYRGSRGIGYRGGRGGRRGRGRMTSYAPPYERTCHR